jgi:hypothetical protein
MNTPRARRALKGGAAILAALALAACSLFESKTEYVPVQVKVPIEIPCSADPGAEPQWATRIMPHVDPATGENLDVAVKRQAVEIEQRKGYEEKLKAANAGCR